MSVDLNLLRYPRGGSAIWTDSSVASTVFNQEFFGVATPPPTSLTVVANTSTGYTTSAVTTTSPISVAVGDRVVVFEIWQFNNTPPTLTDSQSGSFTTLGTVGQAGFIGSGGSWFRTSVREITVASASYTITASKSDGYTSIFAVVVAGVTSIESTQLNDGSAPWSHSITTTNPAMLLGFIAPEGQAALSSIDATPTGFTELNEILVIDYWQGASAYRLATTPGTYTWTPVVSGATVATSGLSLVALYGNTGAGGGDAGYVTVWNGSAWVRKPLKVWNGSSWVIKPVKYWSGSAWVLS